MNGHAGGFRQDPEDPEKRMAETPVVCHKFNVSVTISFSYDEDLYPQLSNNNNHRRSGVQPAMPMQPEQLGYVYLGPNIEFLGFESGSQYNDDALDIFKQHCSYKKENFGVVCEAQSAVGKGFGPPSMYFRSSISAIIQVMPLCGTRSFSKTANAYIEGRITTRPEIEKNPTPADVPSNLFVFVFLF